MRPWQVGDLIENRHGMQGRVTAVDQHVLTARNPGGNLFSEALDECRAPSPTMGSLVEFETTSNGWPTRARGIVDDITVSRDGSWVTIDVVRWRELGISRYIDRHVKDVTVQSFGAQT